ncbi:MAG TPA: AGE family epimerase/isomerase [Xanthobacteraceae bacterium]|nr:AGE family epimerase/isomerase [Xanthobacteraceae bacterium]
MRSSNFHGLRWLVDHAWPLWLEHGVDWRRRAFHEYLDSASLQCRAPFRRLRVAARQTYVFSKAAQYGVPRAKEAVALGLDFLQGPARLPDGGFAWRFDLDNRPIDSTRDLYDHAFALLAFAAAAEVVGADRVHADAVVLLDYIATQFIHPAGGYRDSIPATAPRRQNPHMHLFEALLAASDAFRDELFFSRARDLAALFVARFFQVQEGALPEYFDEALAPRREAGRFLVEAGHHYEWIWLLHRYEKSAAAMGASAGPDLTSAAGSLFEFAERHAVSAANGLVANGNWSDGAVADGGFRLWPQTERLKAVARRRPDCAAPALGAIARHLAGARPGLWIERMDAGGQAIVEAAPATSLYHLTAAFIDDAVLAVS